MSEELKQFYVALHRWITSNFPKHRSFTEYAGLCYNLSLFLRSKSVTLRREAEITEELLQQFRTAKLNPSYPFNEDKKHFDGEIFRYDNAARRDWVKRNAQSILQSDAALD